MSLPPEDNRRVYYQRLPSSVPFPVYKNVLSMTPSIILGSMMFLPVVSILIDSDCDGCKSGPWELQEAKGSRNRHRFHAHKLGLPGRLSIEIMVLGAFIPSRMSSNSSCQSAKRYSMYR